MADDDKELQLTACLDRASPGDLMTLLSGTIPDEMCREFITQIAAGFQDDLNKIRPGRKVLQLTIHTTIKVLVATPAPTTED